MKRSEIEAIATAVVGGLSESGTGLLGCGGISDTTSFNASPGFRCQSYWCGGQGDFGCYSGFFCEGFTCPLPASFDCPQDFACQSNDVFFALPCQEYAIG